MGQDTPSPWSQGEETAAPTPALPPPASASDTAGVNASVCVCETVFLLEKGSFVYLGCNLDFWVEQGSGTLWSPEQRV